jgi:hypothetical protein
VLFQSLDPGFQVQFIGPRDRSNSTIVSGPQRHTIRGFMAGAMKKAGYSVESFKSDKGERTYRINQ